MRRTLLLLAPLLLAGKCADEWKVPPNVATWRIIQQEVHDCRASVAPGDFIDCQQCFIDGATKCFDAGLSDCNFYDTSETGYSCF